MYGGYLSVTHVYTAAILFFRVKNLVSLVALRVIPYFNQIIYAQKVTEMYGRGT